ncbi:uncharacterized protein AB675_2848 [Cyphellophora attinorum]|uniref:Uncharacterized protein n=1 Tax=Cyphellophora attinorum TaxID=1664694 RepID=A0A0N0NRA1_9EURO|nr:uncharacterized protein AB675_2848 [Phialophora attinorum]KPI44851.1 hypothetical protein AB675_2848 [Phialophora attinorum]
MLPLWLSLSLLLPVWAQSNTTNATSATQLPFNITEATVEGDANYLAPTFPLLPFNKYSGNPILTPNPANNWESTYLYNPTAIVLNETIFLLYRAQNESKTSSIGLAWSTDGVNFTRLAEPILYATEPWEQIGGTEDPRIVRINNTFYMTYTAFDNSSAQLCMASSTNLLNWTKTPPLIDVPSPRLNHSKSGAIVSEPTADGLYHMYFGDSFFYHATSPDLRNWTALPPDNYFAAPLNPWENRLIEPGPAPIKTRDGYPQNQYSVGQMLIDPTLSFLPNITVPDGTYQPALRNGPVARVQNPLLVPEASNEQTGQVDQVVFAEGLVQFKGKWYLYFGQGDSELGVAIADVQP